MYSTVLMIALTSVGGHKNSCYTSCHASCYSGVAACSAGCSGCHVSACSSACSGCHVSACHSCYKPKHGLFKKLFGKKCHGCHSCYTCSSSVCSGCYTCSSGCASGEVIMESAPAEEAPKKMEAKEAPKAEGSASASTSSTVRTVSYKVGSRTYVSRPVIVYYSR
jgi:hypothetical protein